LVRGRYEEIGRQPKIKLNLYAVRRLGNAPGNVTICGMLERARLMR
jgi:hypothetical protein